VLSLHADLNAFSAADLDWHAVNESYAVLQQLASNRNTFA
jgi:predicted RNA polymerase sigma factor